ncbi:MAG: cation diffusion facilitator family transporter [Flavobacteriaceae bacterium]|nr:cation diffusion facilitator family transporter [Flavobacteriaceae bacterium]
MTAHQHGEHHHHGPTDLSQINRAFYIGIFLNAAFTAIEFIYGFLYNSLALIADATHNLSDVASLIISLIGLKLTQKAATKLYTYGYKKASILASLINAILLVVVVFNIAKEAIERFDAPPEVSGRIIITVALIGVVINTVSAFLFYKGQKDDINIKGAFLHLLVDALVSVGVVISGILIQYTGWNEIDLIVSIIIAVVILITTWSLLRESIKLTLDGVPKDINVKKIEELISEHEAVKRVYHTHIWALSTNTNAMTAHIVLAKNYSLDEISILKKDLKHRLEHENIQHVTLEFETENDLRQ